MITMLCCFLFSEAWVFWNGWVGDELMGKGRDGYKEMGGWGHVGLCVFVMLGWVG